ncbi:MAG: hypothetical protein CMM60_03945 [Rhodospirillaceae bacterium]|mgnify:CR=1 FL=1|jgi:hypothetical protein|nr:hypothetical protein [Rhodospirillaceae bacterium]|tara:strand:+ start:1381 stop:1950 length:570 start_codon:yes stop_codon:yes gene_type:complete
MISLGEVLTALYGAYRLARLDAGGLGFFDITDQGFWRSFFAAVVVAPLYVILLLIRYSNFPEPIPLFRFIALEAIAYVIAWVAFPLLMASLARMLERDEFYIRYIVAYNWAAVLQNFLYIPIAILAAVGVLSITLSNTLGLLALALIVVYTWFITRTALEVAAGTAAGIVGLDFLLNVFINVFTEAAIK